MAEFNGTADDDVYSGTAGDDLISGQAGNDQLSGGDGNDFIEGGADDDVIDGGSGNDYLYGDLGSPAGNDVVNGGDGSDVIWGGGGNDQLSGGDGDDFLGGEAGNDILVGGSGNDGMNGGAGVDSFDGGADAGGDSYGYGDRVSFSDRTATQGAVADLRTGQISNDGFGNAETMTNVESLGFGTAYADIFYGTDLGNALFGGRGDTLMSFGGDDLIRLNGAPALLDAGAGIDTLRLENTGGFLPDSNGDGLADVAPWMTVGYTIDLAAGTLTDGYGVSGSIAGIERIAGTQWSDVLRGSGADEWFQPGDSDDTVDGRGGIDTLSYASPDHYYYYPHNRGGVFIDLEAGEAIETFTAYETEPGPWEDRVRPSNVTAGPGHYPGQTDIIAGIENVEGTGMGDTIWGDGADNWIAPGAGNDVIDGRGGIDTVDYSTARAPVSVRLDQGMAVESGTGETSFQYGPPDDYFGNVVEADDYSEKTDQLANIENAIGSAFADLLVGNSGANRLEGGGGNDQLRSGGGTDGLYGGGSNDVLYFGPDLSPGDVADGGAGRDAIVLQGDVTVVLSDTNLVDIESISIQSGANAFFGDTANNFYDYDVTPAAGNVAAGQQMIVNAQSLRAGEDFIFDGSAESDGRFLVYGGHGVDDLTGGDGNDVFFFEGTRWGPSDRVDGGAGRDALVISAGDGLTHIEFEADSFTGIESISLNNLFASDPSQKPSYDIVLHNGNVAPGGTLIVNGNSIPLGQVVHIDGSAVHDGNLILFAGGGHDVITGGDGADLIFGGGGQDSLSGGAGADTYRYDSVSDSAAGANDVIGNFDGFQGDRIDLSRIDANSLAEGNQAFTFIGVDAFSGMPGQLRFRDDGGFRWVEADTNGDAVADFALRFYNNSAPQIEGHFIL